MGVSDFNPLSTRPVIAAFPGARGGRAERAVGSARPLHTQLRGGLGGGRGGLHTKHRRMVSEGEGLQTYWPE